MCAAALRAFEPKLGVQAPANFWDPLGYTEVDNVATLKRRRETELKPCTNLGKLSLSTSNGQATCPRPRA